MENTSQNIRITADIMKSEFFRILKSVGFKEDRAEKCAEIFMINSLEGVYSHGVNRFPRFVKYVLEGFVKPDAEPSFVSGTGSLEQWNGNLGPGPLNALHSTDRAMELAGENGIGLVALANTNHWMRGGTYGWQTAKKGFVFIGWTNTCPNMPAWGAKDPRLGNNPFVMAVPYKDEAIVLDFAMSQFSYGKIETYRNDGRQLPYPAGYNKNNELTSNPVEVLETMRAVPVGYWKGASFSLLLDIFATILSGGLSSSQVKSCSTEYNVSQVFIAINLKGLHNFPAIENSISQIIGDLQKSSPVDENAKIRYPGENVVQVRSENLKEGIPVNRGIWEKVLSL
jgi:3-dehydro-L-gulonate 2-dehydrogenase